MKQLIEFIRRDDCPECGASKTIECYDTYGNPINYTFLLNEYERDKNVLGRLNKKILSHMRCRKCRKIFTIYWDDDREIPIPMNNGITNIFFNRFIKNYK